MSLRIKFPITLAIFFYLISATSICLSDTGHGNGEETSAPGVIFSKSLADIPGKRMTVIKLNFEPNSQKPRFPHRHPGSVFIYVTKGTVRFGIEGEPVQELQTGDSFFEPAGALHTVAENASTTEPASVIAVMLLPEGAPILTVD